MEDGDADGEADEDRDEDSDAEAVAEDDGVADSDENVAEVDVLAEGVTLGAALGDAEGDSSNVRARVVSEGDGLDSTDAEVDGLSELAEAEGNEDLVADGVDEALADRVADGEAVIDADDVGDGDALACGAATHRSGTPSGSCLLAEAGVAPSNVAASNANPATVAADRSCVASTRTP